MDAGTMPAVRNAFLVFTTAVACAFPTGDSMEANIEVTGRTASTDPPGTMISFVVVNRSNAALWVPSCGSDIAVAVERLDGQWTSHTSAVCTTNLAMVPFRMEAGEQLSSQTIISGTGVFRLRGAQTNNPQRAMRWNVVSQAIEIFQ